MFHGSSRLNLDSKGRLAIPAKYRDELVVSCEGRLVVTADPDHCLLVYPRQEWEPIQKKLMSLSSFNAKTRALQRLLVGYAEDVEMDGAGRILLPGTLRTYAGLDKSVVIAGQGNRLELWDEEKWSQQSAMVGSLEEDMPSELEGFSL
ncbi:MAG: division/cell wall cluster transcriptional repressor MraZ [Burkholderiales bacterium]|nr:division/cell wall cluster transcriptional repressor MraZ [Burkholderiales bacterium]